MIESSVNRNTLTISRFALNDFPLLWTTSPFSSRKFIYRGTVRSYTGTFLGSFSTDTRTAVWPPLNFWPSFTSTACMYSPASSIMRWLSVQRKVVPSSNVLCFKTSAYFSTRISRAMAVITWPVSSSKVLTSISSTPRASSSSKEAALPSARRIRVSPAKQPGVPRNNPLGFFSSLRFAIIRFEEMALRP